MPSGSLGPLLVGEGRIMSGMRIFTAEKNNRGKNKTKTKQNHLQPAEAKPDRTLEDRKGGQTQLEPAQSRLLGDWGSLGLRVP